MKKQEVESSVIRAVGHTRVLEIEFESGRVYQYFDVPEDLYNEMLTSDSKGRFFNQNIRNKFPYQEVQMVARTEAQKR